MMVLPIMQIIRMTDKLCENNSDLFFIVASTVATGRPTDPVHNAEIPG